MRTVAHRPAGHALGLPTAAQARAGGARDYVTAGDDRQASAEYRKDLVAALVRRTVTKAADRAQARV